MYEAGRLLLSLGLAAIALTLLGAGVVWSRNEARQIRRSFRRVLGDDPHAFLVARGRGRGVGFNFATGQLAVAWDGGAWCLIYRISELIGAELIVDGQVLARVRRDETRRALDLMSGAERLVRLRLIFSDAAYPDFDLDLWTPQDSAREDAREAPEAVREANRWLARVEAIFRRPAFRSEGPRAAQAPPPFDADREPADEPRSLT